MQISDVHGPFVDSHELLMDPHRDLETWELSLACGRLASQAGALQQSSDHADRARAIEARALVERALELVERQRIESNAARGKTKLPELFMRMWRSGPDAEETAPLPRNQNQPPSALHTLSMRAYGPFVPVPDFIGFLCAQRKTGILELTTPAATFSLELEGGDIVQFQIQLLFNRMFEAATLGFTFWDGPPIHAYKRVRLNATSLLLEGARVSDEAHWSWRTGP